MSCKNISRFLRDESGGYTIWSLIWFSLYVAMGGLAVDMSDAYRNQTLLQATADVSSLAAVMSLPDQDDGTAQALAYSAANMSTAINGNVLKAAEVIYGNWNFATRTFAPSTAAPDAARVITRRDEANLNPLATNFLRIIGLQQWNISVEAIA
ncbi:MAG: TadE/TadG family type IV pilus assembly protein, partial [Paracoccaceae bacterium]